MTAAAIESPAAAVMKSPIAILRPFIRPSSRR